MHYTLSIASLFKLHQQHTEVAAAAALLQAESLPQSLTASHFVSRTYGQSPWAAPFPQLPAHP